MLGIRPLTFIVDTLDITPNAERADYHLVEVAKFAVDSAKLMPSSGFGASRSPPIGRVSPPPCGYHILDEHRSAG
jgi:hypothetical protein